MLRECDKQNFQTLLRAAQDGRLALLDCRRRSDGKSVACVCAVGQEGELAVFTPFAVMVEDNPFELFDPPTAEGGPDAYAADDP